jgi:hypothetical protein
LAPAHTLFPVSSTTGWAPTSVRTWSIGTATRIKAIIRSIEALVDVVAGQAIALKSKFAPTGERSRCVGTNGRWTAIVCILRALINVSAGKAVVVLKSWLARTPVVPERVDANFAIFKALVYATEALIDVQARYTIASKAGIALASIRSIRVGAGGKRRATRAG